MNTKIKDSMFFVIVFSLIFNHLPKAMHIGIIAGPLGWQLAFYPVIAGMIYTAYCQWKYRNVLVKGDVFSKYILAYASVVFLSLVLGIINFPYYDWIINGPADQVEKLPKVLAFLNSHGIVITPKQLLSVWMFARPIKGLLLDIIYTFGTSYMIFCWYFKDWKRAVDILVKGSLATLVVTVMYSSVEILYLVGNKTATDILKTINPYIHAIVTDVNWWPPLLWKGQLRSVFSEPSRIGNYAALVLPILWWQLYKEKSYLILLGTFAFTFMVFLTKARTANAMFFGMIGILLVLTAFKWREYYKKFLMVALCSMFAFVCAIGFLNNYMGSYKVVNKDTTATEAFLNDNVKSLANNTQRSNGARYALLRSNLRVGMEHPLLGVGTGLQSAYIMDNFTEAERKNGEVKMWLNYIKKHGIMKYELGAMNEYVGRFAQTGLLGLFAFLLPFAFAVYKLFFRFLKTENQEIRMTSMFLLLALISTCVAAMNGSINLIFTYWVVLPVCYVVIHDVEKQGASE